MRDIVARIAAAGGANGTIRADVEPDDGTVCLAGAVLMTTTSTDADQLRRLLDMLLDGLRPR